MVVVTNRQAIPLNPPETSFTLNAIRPKKRHFPEIESSDDGENPQEKSGGDDEDGDDGDGEGDDGDGEDEDRDGGDGVGGVVPGATLTGKVYILSNMDAIKVICNDQPIIRLTVPYQQENSPFITLQMTRTSSMQFLTKRQRVM